MSLRKSKITVEQIRQLWANGVSVKDIAQMAGVGLETIRYHLNPWRLRRYCRKYYKTTIREVLRKRYRKDPEFAAQIKDRTTRRVNRLQEETKEFAEYAGERWVGQDIDFLFENATRMTQKELALKLGRTFKSVSRKLEALRIKSAPKTV